MTNAEWRRELESAARKQRRALAVYDRLHIPVVWLRSVVILGACAFIAAVISGQDFVAEVAGALGDSAVLVPVGLAVWLALEIWMGVAKHQSGADE
ncbi:MULTISPECIES: hypothetical protein [unclassified Microbacterium]|uniref:hypothetical protein n=1 Tax=unclassified Microbacterium TaxID=2609290 RepID=UPI0016050CDA|nr:MULTISPECIES: hypothetical protein [unclassified Microbacterium]QNA93248.1 hypothetical protein G4G29_14680 [Microbacterium sp. Se63.02b]QYM63457.1 hypothetical protein K1X59_14730 [Microbacterium sp. Se5.02b]